MKNNNNLYWQKRLATALETIEEDVNFQLAKGYWKTLGTLLKELQDLYEYILASPNPTLNSLYQYNRYQQLINDINIKLTQLGVQETSILENALIDMYVEVSKLISERYELPTITIDREDIREKIRKVWTTDNKNWSDRIWADKDKLKNELTQTLTDAIATGKNSSQFADELGNRLNVSRGRAKTLLRTELAHLENSTSLDRYRDAGVKYIRIKNGDFKRKLAYTSKNGAHFYDIPCEFCKENEIIYDINDPALPILPFHPHCRCSYIPVMDANI